MISKSLDIQHMTKYNIGVTNVVTTLAAITGATTIETLMKPVYFVPELKLTEVEVTGSTVDAYGLTKAQITAYALTH